MIITRKIQRQFYLCKREDKNNCIDIFSLFHNGIDPSYSAKEAPECPEWWEEKGLYWTQWEEKRTATQHKSTQCASQGLCGKLNILYLSSLPWAQKTVQQPLISAFKAKYDNSSSSVHLERDSKATKSKSCIYELPAPQSSPIAF